MNAGTPEQINFLRQTEKIGKTDYDHDRLGGVKKKKIGDWEGGK